MNKIDCKKWNLFKISDIFETKYIGKQLQVPTGAYVSRKNLKEGEMPRITVSGFDNGINGYYDSNDKNYRVFENFISVSFLGTVFYQKSKASLDMKVHCLKPKKIILNDAIAFFLATIIKKTITDSKYSDQISSTVLPIIDILLPSIKKDDGSYAPDWQYMEKYIDNVKQIVEQKFDKIKQIKEDKNVINSQQWAYFHLYDMFDIDMGSKLDKIKMKMDNPQIDFVGRANKEQGVTAKVNIIENIPPYKAGNLTLALGGAYLGSCFIQRNDFYTSQNVIVLKPKTNMSFKVKQFLSTTIFVESQLHYKAFIDELNPHIKTDFEFKLPVDTGGNPDWKYMEDYISIIETKVKRTIKSLYQR